MIAYIYRPNANCVIALGAETGVVSRALRKNRSKLIGRERDLQGHRTDRASVLSDIVFAY